jgi:glycosyltransferase involved in cell wall biosynthesis
MRSLVIAPQPFFSTRGTPFSVYYRTLILAKLGVEIDLLTYGQGEDVDIPGVRTIRIPRFGILGDVKIGPSLLKLFLDAFVFIWAVVLLTFNRYTFVHAHEEAVFLCRLLKPIFKFKLVYDMHSSLPQQLTNFQFTTSKWLIDIFRRFENGSLKDADAIITICPDLFHYVNSEIGLNQRHFLIENSIFEPVKFPSNKTAESSGTDEAACLNAIISWRMENDKKLIVYAGTLEPYQGIDILIKSFQYVVAKIPQTGLLIVGGDTLQIERYSRLALKCGLNDTIKFTGRVSQKLAKHFCRMATVLASPRSEGTNTPLKIYEQMASGIPLVATNIYSHTQVLNNEVAFLVNPNPKDMARGFIHALNGTGERRNVAESAKSLYERKYSRPVYERKMKMVLEFVS